MRFPSLLILTDWFAPGYRAGGPIRSIVNLTKALQQDLRIFILTSNKDHQSATPYPDISPDQWCPFDHKIQVFYASESQQNLKTVKRIIEDLQPDCIYLNSMYSRPFTIYPLWLLWKGQMSCPVVLAPRGMLKESALQFKPWKKQLYLSLWRRLKLPQKIHFHATTKEEAASIQKVFGQNVSITTLNNLPQAVHEYVARDKSVTKFIFVGRIHPIKGLDHLLSSLKKIDFPAQLTIAGNKEELPFWKKCQKMIRELPEHVVVEDVGEQPHHQLQLLLQDHHFLTLPTQGENFGHAIFEALAAGLPVIISDQTPWRNLRDQNIGWDLPLSCQSAYIGALNEAAKMDQTTYNHWSQSAWQYAKNYIDNSTVKQQYLELFSRKV